MSRRASGGTLAAFLILAAIVGFAGGAYLGTQSGDDNTANTPVASATENGDEPNDETDTDAEGDEENNDDDPPSENGVTLQVEESTVAPNARINYSGTISPAEAGVSVRVQRSLDGGEWTNFPEDNPITRDTNEDGSFSGYLQTGRSGENSFRVIRTDDESVVSEPVTVTVQ